MRAMFRKLAQYDSPAWAVLDWECCLKSAERGAAEGAVSIRDRVIELTRLSFERFAQRAVEPDLNSRVLDSGSEHGPSSLKTQVQ